MASVEWISSYEDASHHVTTSSTPPLRLLLALLQGHFQNITEFLQSQGSGLLLGVLVGVNDHQEQTCVFADLLHRLCDGGGDRV